MNALKAETKSINEKTFRGLKFKEKFKETKMKS